MMFVEEEPPRIEIATIDDVDYGIYPAEPQTKYFAALHEIGHVYYGHTQGRPPFGTKQHYFENGVLKSECQAWDYAITQCLDPLKQATKDFALKCFSTYRDAAILARGKPRRLGNGNRHYVEFVYDAPYTSAVLDTLHFFGGIKQKVDGFV